jgi:hypothetical protein
MAYVKYRDIDFKDATRAIIGRADLICREYAAAGYSLTLRQLFYRFVANGWLPNKQSEYKRLGAILDNARYAGLIDWDHIVDRTRTFEDQPHWGSVSEEGADSALAFVKAVMPQYRIPKWENQPTRVEVWVEKEALLDVVARPARRLDVGWFACRGYNSSSNAHEAAERIEGYYDGGAERVVIVHLGDHDPSGIDMSRDIEARFRTVLAGDGYEQADPVFVVRRIALTMAQVREYNPPPNPAKETDARFSTYAARYGATSWELDALDPPTLDALITEAVLAERDDDLWDIAQEREAAGHELLRNAADRWSDIAAFLGGS